MKNKALVPPYSAVASFPRRGLHATIGGGEFAWLISSPRDGLGFASSLVGLANSSRINTDRFA